LGVEFQSEGDDGPETLRYEATLDYQTPGVALEELSERVGGAEPRHLIGRFPNVDRYGFVDERTGEPAAWGYSSSVLSRWPPDYDKHPTVSHLSNYLRRIRRFLVEPAEIAKPVVGTKGAELTPTGAGLAAVLENLRNEDSARFEELVEVLREAVPFVGHLTFDHAGQSQKEVIVESPAGRLPLKLESDGLCRVLAILATRFGLDRPSCALFDEIENGLHPDALEVVLRSLREMSEEPPRRDPFGPKPLVMVTSHSPIAVASFQEHPEAVLVAARDKQARLDVFPIREAGNRLDAAKLKRLIKEFGLRELWLAGALDPDAPE
jgi:hypothetical protein